jgi:hypothetical protein
MKKISCLIIIIAINQMILSAQTNSDGIKENDFKNSFRLGVAIATQGTGDQVGVLYQLAYQRKITKYFELDLSTNYFNYNELVHPNYYEPDIVKKNITSIVTFDLLLNLLIIDFNKQILKLGTGYSFRYTDLFAWNGAQYYFDENYHYSYAKYVINDINGWDGGIIVNIEYGYRIFPHFATTISAKYYAEDKYISLAGLGVNFYYSF